ncbi:MAG: phosphopantetheine-binding protein, partial [Burkholderiales bacterium]
LVRKYCPSQCVLFTGLGSTEAGTVRQLFITRDTRVAGSVLPLGYAVEGMEIRLLDENGNDVGFDNVGEIAICSRYLFPGYWRQPELTKKVLMPDSKDADKQIFRTGDLGKLRPDGLLLHAGRTDSQVKIRGFRVEIAEIESALLEYRGIDDAIVVIQEDQRGEKHLVAYVKSDLRPLPTFAEIRLCLARTLPRHMLPSAIFFTDAFALTPNGKVDRRSLAEVVFVPSGQDTGFVAPRNAMEKAIAGIWSEVLGAEQIGIHDDFFDLGGNSLLASQVLSRIKNIFDTELSLPILFNQPTVAALAAAIEAQLSGVRPASDAISAEREEGVL